MANYADMPGWMAQAFGYVNPTDYTIGPRNTPDSAANIPTFDTSVRIVPKKPVKKIQRLASAPRVIPPITPQAPISDNLFPRLQKTDLQPTLPPADSFHYYPEIFQPYANKIQLEKHTQETVPSMDATEGRTSDYPSLIGSILRYLNDIRDSNIERREQRQNQMLGQ